MKFRAVMQDPQDMKEFVNIILTLSKLTKSCIMNISSEKINFIVGEDAGNAAPLVWAEVFTDTIFSEYIMEGVSEMYQQIMLSFNPSNLARAILVLRNGAKYCKLKLTNIQYPCLTIEMEVPSNVSEVYRQVVHDVPITLIPRVDWSGFSLPQVPKTKVFLTLASNRTIRNHIDKLKNLSPSITFYATSNGEMNVAAETELSTVTTRYKNLEVREINATPTTSGGSEGRVDASCTVDCKKMAVFFSSLQVSTLEWSCGIIDDSLIHLEIDVRRGVTVHSIVPAVCV